jgi:hypothetical protein
VDNELILEESLDSFEGLSSFEVADTGDELLGYILVVAHAYLDG